MKKEYIFKFEVDTNRLLSALSIVSIHILLIISGLILIAIPIALMVHGYFGLGIPIMFVYLVGIVYAVNPEKPD